jgi:hypothetical protein
MVLILWRCLAALQLHVGKLLARKLLGVNPEPGPLFNELLAKKNDGVQAQMSNGNTSKMLRVVPRLALDRLFTGSSGPWDVAKIGAILTVSPPGASRRSAPTN